MLGVGARRGWRRSDRTDRRGLEGLTQIGLEGSGGGGDGSELSKVRERWCSWSEREEGLCDGGG